MILVGANVLCGAEPEGHVTSTTVYLDTDYVVDQRRRADIKKALWPVSPSQRAFRGSGDRI